MPLIDQPDTPELIDHQNSFAEGVVNNRESHLLTPFQAYHLLNCDLDMDGRVRKAHGFNKRGPANLDLSGKMPFGLFAFEPEGTQRSLLAHYANELYQFSDHQASAPFTWQRVASNVSFVSTHYMAAQGQILGTPGSALFLCACVSESSTGHSYSQLAFVEGGGNFSAAQVSYTGLFAKSITWFQRRLWAVNERAIVWSALNDGSSRAPGSPDITFGPVGEYDPNMAIVPLREPTPRMLIFRKSSVWLLDIYWTTDGFYASTADTMDFTKALIRPIVQEVGLMAPRAVTWIPGAEGGDYLFLSREGIRSLNRSLTDVQGGAGLPISWKIQKTIDRINWDRADRSVATFHNGLAYFSFPIDGAQENNFVVAYDVRYEHFYFMDWEAAAFTRMRYPGRDVALYFQSSKSVAENYTSPAFNVTHQHVYDTSSGLVGYGGSAIDFDVQTRGYVFDIGDPIGSGLRYRKKNNWLELGMKPGGTTASFGISYKVNHASAWSAFGAFSILSTETGVIRKKFSLRNIPPSRVVEFRIRDNLTMAQPELEYVQVSAHPLNPLVE